MIAYPTLTGEIAKRKLRKKEIAEGLGMSEKALRGRLTGQRDFTWPEAVALCRTFFPDLGPEELLRPAEREAENNVCP